MALLLVVIALVVVPEMPMLLATVHVIPPSGLSTAHPKGTEGPKASAKGKGAPAVRLMLAVLVAVSEPKLFAVMSCTE